MSEYVNVTEVKPGDILNGRIVTEVRVLTRKTAITTRIAGGGTAQAVYLNWQSVAVAQDDHDEELAGINAVAHLI
jgi:hypothetical protein